jgi:cation diffusion facilitator family transporter
VSDSIEGLPHDRRGDLKRARRLEMLSFAYLASTITFLVLVMGGSQAVKTEFVDDLLSAMPPLLFLVGDRISGRKPSERYPYGFARAVSAAYLGAAVALLLIGGYLLFDAVTKLLHQEHPSLGGVAVFGHVVWMGWLGLAALTWSAVPAFFLGRAKQKAGERLHDKVLVADAKSNAADWQSAAAAMIGILGIAAGIWWLDAAAAAFISFEIIRSGLSEVRSALGDLMDRRPQQLIRDELDPLPEELTRFFKSLPWVGDAVVRVREEGRQFTGEVFVVPSDEADLLDHIGAASRDACELDWRLKEMLVTPVREIPLLVQRVRADQDGDQATAA